MLIGPPLRRTVEDGCGQCCHFCKLEYLPLASLELIILEEIVHVKPVLAERELGQDQQGGRRSFEYKWHLIYSWCR